MRSHLGPAAPVVGGGAVVHDPARSEMGTHAVEVTGAGAAERSRLVAYRSHYPETHDDGAFERVLDGLADTSDADDLLRRFLMIYAVEGGADREAQAAFKNRPATASDQ